MKSNEKCYSFQGSRSENMNEYAVGIDIGGKGKHSNIYVSLRRRQ